MEKQLVTLEVSILVSGEFFKHGFAVAEIIKHIRELCIQYPADARVADVSLKTTKSIEC